MADAAATTSATPGTSSGTPAQSSQGSAGTGPATQTQGKDAGGGKTAQGQGSAQPQAQEDEFEEIKLGSVGGKVPKAIAKAIKDYERGVQDKFKTTAAERKQINEIMQKLQDPREYFKMRGMSADEFAEKLLAEKLEQAAMSPDQKKLREIQAERDRLAEEKQAREQQDKQAKLTAEEQKQDREIRQGVMKAWQSSGLPEHPHFGQRIVAEKMRAEAQGLDWTWEDCAARVKEDFESHLSSTVSKLEAEALVKLLGPETLKKLRQYDVAQATAKAALKQTGSSNTARPAKSAASPKKNFEGRTIVAQDDWDDAWSKL